MKVRNYCLLIAVLLGCFSITLGQNANGCSSGLRNGISYTDCWTDTGDDTTRLQAALSTPYAAGRKLVFNESSYSVSSALTVPTNTTLEGQSMANTGGALSNITLTGTNTSIFLIGYGVQGITIKDLALKATSLTGTVGIEATAGTSDLASGLFHFDGLQMYNFDVGFEVKSTGGSGWQFDEAHLENSSFDHCNTAVYIDTLGGGMQINNLGISSGAGQNGIHIEYGGYITMHFIVGNGHWDGGGDADANEFIYIKNHGPINIQDAEGEAYKKSLIIDGQSKFYPVILQNSDLPECHYTEDHASHPSVVLKDAVVVSSGNNFFCSGEVAQPSIEGWADVYSTGDRFCVNNSSECFDSSDPYDMSTRSGWKVIGTVAVLRTESPVNDLDDVYNPFVEIKQSYNDYIETENGLVYRPMLSLSSIFDDGDYINRYTFSQNAVNNRLEIKGTLNGHANDGGIGFQFVNGPVQLHNVAAASLSGFNATGDKGSMLYCTDCTAGTNPCSTAGGGGGALAIKIQSGNWACK
jgi:hypothetical protein